MNKNLREEVYSFEANWFDPHAQLVRKFHLRYFVETQHIEIKDVKTNRLFLKKTKCPATVNTNDFYLGSKILLYGRNYELMDYLDPFTRGKLQQSRQHSIVVIHASVLDKAGNIIDTFCRQGFTIAALKLLQLKREEILAMYAHNLTSSAVAMNETVDILSVQPVLALMLVGENSIEKSQQIAASLRGRYGSSRTSSSNNYDPSNPTIEIASTPEDIDLRRKIFFEKKRTSTASLKACTCCVIQPHILKEGKLGQVLEALQSKTTSFPITAMEMFNLDRASAMEFLEVYDGVVPHFNDAVDELMTGPCVALELAGQDAVAQMRELAGPWDIDMAKELKPTSIRAQFGQDRVRNGIHCTDLPEDGVLESQYFFDILSRK